MSNPGEKPLGVLFVCTGNICRSPTAEAVFRHKARAAGLEHRFRIDSAGTHGYHVGDPPDPRAIATALAVGIDMRNLRARKVRENDFAEFDYVFAMDSGHFSHLSQYVGAGKGLAMYSTDPAYRDVPDPYYGTQADFDLVLRLISEETDRLLSRLRETHEFKSK